jgi:hypothetical protein
LIVLRGFCDTASVTRISGSIGGLGLVMGLAAGLACTPTGPQTSDEESGSDDTGCVPGSENCECTEDNGCDPGLQCASMRCIPADDPSTTTVPPPTTTTEETTEGPGTATETSGDSTGTTETGEPQCDPADGVENKACSDTGAPYCSAAGVCVDCSGIACADVAASTPTCDAGTGLCVQCTAEETGACAGTTPICDAAAAKCVACSDHEQCELGACNLATGACFESALYVDRAASCASGVGTVEAPFCEIADAVAEIQSNDPVVIRVKSSPAAYLKKVDISAGRTIAIVRDGNGLVQLEVDNNDSLATSDDSRVFLYNLQISEGTVHKGIVCLNGDLWLDKVAIVDRKGIGIDGVDCTLQIRRSKIFMNLAGGVRLNGGTARIENSYFASNGGNFADIAGLTLTNGASFEGLYLTLVDNDGKAGIGESLHCTAQGTVTLRNSIVFGQSSATSVSCGGATAETSVVDAMALMSDDVVVVPALDPDWFTSPASGDFSLKGGPPFEGVGVWHSGDPAIDYDGTPRPAEDGASDYVGADVP